MNSDKAQPPASNTADENAIRAIHRQMIDTWNGDDGKAFAAPFVDDAQFLVWEGTHLNGREEIARFTKRIFDTVMTGSRLEGQVKFVRMLSPVLAMMHSIVGVTLPGQSKPSPGRDSMELTVVRKRDGEWRGAGLMNARKLTIDRQLLLDDLDSLTPEDQQEVSNFVAFLKKRHLRTC